MAWQAITDTDIEPAKLVFSRVWRSFVDNPEAVHAGDLGSVPAGKRILVDNQASPLSAIAGQILLCSTAGAELVTDTQQIDTVAPFFFWDTVGAFLWVVPVSAWYEIQVHGGGAGGLVAQPGGTNDVNQSPDGALVRVMQFLSAGTELNISVGSGGAVGISGGDTVLESAAGFQIIAGGGPAVLTYAAPFLTPTTSLTGVDLVLCDVPANACGYSDNGLSGFQNRNYGSAAVGQGGPSTQAGRRGCVVIERVSFGG